MSLLSVQTIILAFIKADMFVTAVTNRGAGGWKVTVQILYCCHASRIKGFDELACVLAR